MDISKLAIKEVNECAHNMIVNHISSNKRVLELTNGPDNCGYLIIKYMCPTLRKELYYGILLAYTLYNGNRNVILMLNATNCFNTESAIETPEAFFDIFDASRNPLIYSHADRIMDEVFSVVKEKYPEVRPEIVGDYQVYKYSKGLTSMSDNYRYLRMLQALNRLQTSHLQQRNTKYVVTLANYDYNYSTIKVKIEEK